MWLNQYPFTLQKAPGGNMSYIPPWVPSGSSGGHYPPHMIPPQQPTTAHSPQSTLSSSSPLGSPQMYQSLSPVSKTPHNNVMLTQSNNSPKSAPSTMPPSSPPPPISSSISTTSVTQAAAAAAAAAVAAAVAASASSGGSNSSPTGGNHGNIDSPYEPQGYAPHRPVSPSKHHHDIKSEIPPLHNLPELALGLAGPSAFDPKAHRKFGRSSPIRSPGKYPAPEQLATPVMYSYQGRGRPRKHFTHATGLPTMLPVTHPSSSNSDDADDEENKPFKCNVCLKGFKLKGGLQQHERTHSTDRPYVCPDCGKLFRQPTHLQQHMRIHTGEKPYDCTFCDKSFRQRTILNQHLRIHTGEKPYVCMECGKQFRQKAILDQHYRTHLGDKPYACPHPACRKHFREMASLISHMKCHKDVPDPKIVLQQAKRFIKEEKLDEYGNHEGSGIGTGPNIEVLTIPHPPGLSNNHDGPPERDPGGGRYQSNGEQHGSHNARSYSSSSASTPNQRSPHSLHAQTQGGGGGGGGGGNSSNPSNESQSVPHSQSISSGMMPTPPQMAMANLIPYPHSIFPATSYMMTSPPDPRQYHQLPSSASQSTPGNQSSSIQSRPNQ